MMKDGRQSRRITTAVSPESRAPAAKPGLRERNKLSKERMIRQAARKLFRKKGFAETTLREIAQEADVGFGTVFAYASDKAGLLAMIFVEELKELPPPFENLPAGPLLDQVTAALGRLYEFWARIPTLSHLVLQQMEFYSDNPHMQVIIDRRRQIRADMAAWLAELQKAGVVKANIQVTDAADTLFAIYTSCVREWSVTVPDDCEAGVARLKQLMALPVSALQA